ncbi:ParB/RepB/Spo0J family partition protein [Cohnella thailandensis]|uniref:ParB/RepB/Spo0J family partition protein n=1 Tax=Cohnella thailandensis TaxID=557557 RepID=A0A841T799_9BACL|nr:ParB/RepB/Spo0J family partition protein [Cohnella thailandensis]MBB6637727.1 ParB/RepB/Spo0J family partition protein [Cohnella thailandensis]MBP1974096.1 ParB family chromosome partitioning protein [Cohnella thailandensis]
MDIVNLRIDLIDEDTEQPRYQFDDEALQELMNSIGELGLLSPIKVRTTPNGRYKIIYGNRRFKACTMLGLATIPCIVSSVTDETEIYLEQIAENLTREGFSPIEEAEAFHKMLNDPRFSCSVKFLSGKLGKPENYIKNKLELLKFGNAVKKLIVAGSEIRKDKLTEEQLLPLKDLPMEYRDTLALTFARDETPVPDIKRIAKLFKDPGVSDGLKSKLLYKSGYELLETWSTFEHNRKERAKREKERAEAEEAARLEAEEAAKLEAEGVAARRNADEATAQGADSASAAASSAADPLLAPLPEVPQVAAQSAGEPSGSGAAAKRGQSPVALVEQEIARLLGTLPTAAALEGDDLPALDSLRYDQLANLGDDVDRLIAEFEQQLAEWRKVRAAIGTRLS